MCVKDIYKLVMYVLPVECRRPNLLASDWEMSETECMRSNVRGVDGKARTRILKLLRRSVLKLFLSRVG